MTSRNDDILSHIGLYRIALGPEPYGLDSCSRLRMMGTSMLVWGVRIGRLDPTVMVLPM